MRPSGPSTAADPKRAVGRGMTLCHWESKVVGGDWIERFDCILHSFHMLSMFWDICERSYVFGVETHFYGSLVISSHNTSLRRLSEDLITEFLRRWDQQ